MLTLLGLGMIICFMYLIMSRTLTPADSPDPNSGFICANRLFSCFLCRQPESYCAP